MRKSSRFHRSQFVGSTYQPVRIAVLWLLSIASCLLMTGCGSKEPNVPIPAGAEWSDVDESGFQFTQTQQTSRTRRAEEDWFTR